MESKSAATGGVIESDVRALCIGDNNKENSLLRPGQLFKKWEGNIRALVVEKAQKRRAIVKKVENLYCGKHVQMV